MNKFSFTTDLFGDKDICQCNLWELLSKCSFKLVLLMMLGDNLR